MLSLRTLLLAFFCLLLFGCSQPQVQKEETFKEKEAKLQATLSSIADRIAGKIDGKQACMPAFYKEGSKIEPAVSRYIVPQITSLLVQKGCKILDRKDLARLLQELNFQETELFQRDAVKRIGHWKEADTIILGTVQDQSSLVYQVEVKVVDLRSSMVLGSFLFEIDRQSLPIKYGGKI